MALIFHMSSAVFLFLLIPFPLLSDAEIPDEVSEKIKLLNSKGPYYTLVVAGEAELKAVLGQGWFRPDKGMPSLDISARSFYVREVQGCRTIPAMSGSRSVNAAHTTQLLLTYFRVKGVIRYGRAGSANPKGLRFGDVAIPQQFAHGGVWYREKFGDDDGSYTRKIANLTFAEYNVESDVKNRLQSVYFQPETVYAKPDQDGKSEFWFNVDEELYATAKRIQDTKLDRCLPDSKMCLQERPEIRRVERGGSANFYVKNEAFRDFLHNNLNIATIDTESAAIAMVCASEKIAFIAMRSVTNYAGGSSAGNDESVIKQLWFFHAAAAIQAFLKQVAYSNLRSVSGGDIW